MPSSEEGMTWGNDADRVLQPERRHVVRRAIGQTLLGRLNIASSERRSIERVRLVEGSVFEDLKHAWVGQPMIDMLFALHDVLSVDFDDDREVGSLLRPAVGLLANAVERVVELRDFVNRFEGGAATNALIDAYAAGLGLAAACVEWLVNDDAPASQEEAVAVAWAAFEARAALAMETMPQGSPEDFGLPLVTGEEEFERLLGVSVGGPHERWHDLFTALLDRGYDPRELGRRQLGYLGEYEAPEDRVFSDNYIHLALRVGTATYPLLAHRAAWLSRKLFEAAEAKNLEATALLLGTFFQHESGWIINSSAPFEKALELYEKHDDRPSILEAHRVLSEGVYRRYGALAVGLAAIAHGDAVPDPLVPPTISTVGDQLTASGTDLGALLREFADAGLRNADAHASAGVGGDGQLLIRQTDGSVITVNPNQVWAKTTALRSALIGLDATANLAYRRLCRVDTEADAFPWPAFVPEALLHWWATMAANTATRGQVTRVEAREGVLTLTFEGDIELDELRAMLNAFLPTVRKTFAAVRVVTPDGAVLANLNRDD